MEELKILDYMDDFKNCLQYEKPYCQPACPFHLDVNDFVEKIKRSSVNSAFKLYRNAVGFPRIVSQICSQPCQDVCPMKDHGGAIELKELEKSVIVHAKRTEPTSYNVPARPGKVAIIGSGLAGLGALLRMATKKYEVHLFEKNHEIGGKLNDDENKDLYLKDINDQLQHEKYELHLNSEINSREELNSMGFDVVFVATGKNGNDFDLLNAENSDGHKHVLLDGKTAWFAGGALINEEDVYALAGGLYMGLVLEAYIKTGNLNYADDEMSTNIITDEKRILDQAPASPVQDTYSKDEMDRESKRCLQCQCNFCRTYEDLTAFEDKWPLRIKDEVFATSLEGASEVKATPAKRLVSTANFTGIVKAVCPKNIDMDGLILAGKQKMHRLEKTPWAFHDFWLRDMDFSDGENASIIKNSPKTGKANYAFFPGCQFGASLPELVDKSYEYLLELDQNTGLMLRCCGAPAEWSGNYDKHGTTLEQFRKQWEELGTPILITACPTCSRQIGKNLPDIDTISIYEYMEQNDPDIGTRFRTTEREIFSDIENGVESKLELSLSGKTERSSVIGDEIEDDIESEAWSVFDPCSTRENEDVKQAVRKLVQSLNIPNNELPEQSDVPRCCSFGGQPAIASPEYVDYVVDKRINENDLPYITYCINCRDSFTKAGKNNRHILEVIFDTQPESMPTVSQRRDNRVYLKKSMLGKYWSEEMKDARKEYDIELIIPDEIYEDMDANRILEEEVYNVVDFLLRTNRRVVDPETGIHSGYRQIGYMTYWVSFKETATENVYEIVDVYDHRMEIELEAVWNGVKTEADM